MIIVADSAPLHYLILLDLPDLLPQLYGDVLVPTAVVRELSGGGAPKKVREWLGAVPVWLQIKSVAPEHTAIVSDELDPGEREAIALARLVYADLLLIDESDGRKEARRLSLKVTGTLGVLRAAAERALIEVPVVVANLRATNFYLDESLIRSAFGKWLG